MSPASVLRVSGQTDVCLRERSNHNPVVFRLVWGLVTSVCVASPGWASEQPGFPEDDIDARIAQVNEGELRFLNEPPPTPVHHHYNEIDIGPDSLDTGWVQLSQCHRHLDPVPASEIVYRPERIRGLRILETEGVGSAWVEGPSVQLEDVRKGARVCIAAESRALEPMPRGVTACATDLTCAASSTASIPWVSASISTTHPTDSS